RLPKDRQTLFFSATMPNAVSGLAGDILRDPERVSVTPASTPVERIEQSVIFLSAGQKADRLAEILRDPALDRTIVFTRTKHRADRVARHLAQAGIESAAIHGNKSQNVRQRTLKGFRDGRVRVLVATDIAARGIDIDGVSHIINFELPNVPEDYVHRIGRTARAGASGTAIAFCDPEEQAYLSAIEALTRHKLRIAGGEPARAAPSAKKPARGPQRRRRRRPGIQGQRHAA
ncbi:MAG TPA: DEAD/DEAH box helicase, partial [Afifellaceae bacterium]|nr:DEAD/DEAH box helicase [Afifellaceae bacterium]